MILKKKNSIKNRKQRLIDRINSCKKEKEIIGWEKTFKYHDVLKNDENWDYDFFIRLIEFKLKLMSQYFHTHHIVENEDWYGTLCDRALNILNAGYLTDIVHNSELGDIYVNIKNEKRFIPGYLKRIDHNSEYWNKYGLASIREEKAKALFWKFLHHYVELWWD